MKKIQNSDLIKKILLLLITIAGRRSSDVIASAFIEAILKTLEERYDFLKNIEIKDVSFQEGLRSDAIQIKKQMNDIKKELIGEAIESIIRVLCMDLEEDTGLYFIHELKTRLEEKYILALNECGVDLYLLKLEQQHLHEQLERKKTIIHHESESKNEEIKIEMPTYSWTEVETFKFRNNICFLYNKKGNLLDRLNIGKIIEYYVRTLTDFGKLVLKKDKLEITEKQKALLKLLYERDVDEDMALHFLEINKSELNHMLHQLLRNEYLQYISYDEIKLTERGIELLEQNFEEPIEVATS